MTMLITDALKKVIEGENLTEQEMIAVMSQIMGGQATPSQMSAFITALRIKGETVDEITGAAKVMRKNAISIPVTTNDVLIDTCGTGGDGKNTFNISTAAAFVISGAGIRVAKHGNRSVSSNSGSADVMEQLGVNISISPESTGRCIDEVGVGFLFAPSLHHAMKYAAPVRKEIGIRTIFNILGPLTNPADAEIQILGVYAERLTEMLAHVLKSLGRKRALVVHGRDGLDEITLGSATVIYELKDGEVQNYLLNPQEYGFNLVDIHEIKGGTPAVNAQIILNILQGQKGPQRDIVCLNAGAAIMAAGKAHDMQTGLMLAAQSIDSGFALEKLNALKKISSTLA